MTYAKPPVVEHWLEREIIQWVHHDGSIQRSIAPLVDDVPRMFRFIARVVFKDVYITFQSILNLGYLPMTMLVIRT